MRNEAFNRRVILLTVALSVLSFSIPLSAQQTPEEVTRAYAVFYGDGMRHYAEGRNDDAIANFYRAYALKPGPLLLKLIVRTHDFMGHCTAASKQLEHFADKHPQQAPPKLQICRDPGFVTVSCPQNVTEIMIDDQIQARCDQQLALPPGAHSIRALEGGPGKLTVVRSGEHATTSVDGPVPGQDYRKVPLLEDNERYIVIKSPDGLYQLWVRTSLRDDPDMERDESGPAGFTVHKGADGLFHISSDALREVRPGSSADTSAKGKKSP